MAPLVSVSVCLTPQFHDLDPMNVVWHGNYPRFFESARAALLEKINYTYRDMETSGFAWPVIDMHIRYYRPTTLYQEIEVQASIVEWENRLKLTYLVKDINTGSKLVRGHTIHVAVDLKTGEMQWETPEVFREKLSAFF